MGRKAFANNEGLPNLKSLPSQVKQITAHAGFNDIKILEAGSLLSKLTHIYVNKKKCVSHPFRTES